MHTSRPNQIMRWEKMVHSSIGTWAIRSRSTLTGSWLEVSSSRRESRPTWVSTTTPSLREKNVPRTTLAVLRPTPGSSTSSSIVSGTSPPWCSSRYAAAPWIDLALLRKNPVAWMAASTSARSAAARSAGVGQRRNSSGVTWLTTTSVDCADRMVATSNSQAERWSRAVVTMG